jgi:hypothetical protein
MKNATLAALVLAALSTIGCAAGYGGRYATTAPPPLRAEAYGRAPGPGYVWTSGSWGWSGGRYTWVQGRWVRPPRRHGNWEAGRWERRGDRYYFREGRWR